MARCAGSTDLERRSVREVGAGPGLWGDGPALTPPALIAWRSATDRDQVEPSLAAAVVARHAARAGVEVDPHAALRSARARRAAIQAARLDPALDPEGASALAEAVADLVLAAAT